jgi:hypothetical protein
VVTVAFNFRAFVRFIGRLLSRLRDPSYPWTPRRAGIFLALYLVYPLLEAGIWLGLFLDNLFFRAYRQVQVTAPVFIVGNFRSGTTFLHRLLALDQERFATMKMWEILFAPSIVQRKIADVLQVVDRHLGRLLHRQVREIEQQWHEENTMHRTSLREPEEDEYLLLHIWSALTLGLSSGLLEEATPYTTFDTALSPAERARIMGFYRRCVQRHLYAHECSGKQYLAKNPALTPKLDSVLEAFPDAKIICLVRNPLDAVPSFVHMMQLSWRVVGAPRESDQLREFVVDMARDWYRYPLERLSRAPDASYAFVHYDDLVTDPEGTVAGLYRHFGFELHPAFARALHQAGLKARRFESRHHYSLEQTGLSRERILAEYGEVFDHFGFDTAEAPQPEERQKPAARRGASRRPTAPRSRSRPRPGLTPQSGS